MDTMIAALWSKIASYLDPAKMLERLIDDAWIFPLVILLEVLILGYRRSSLPRFYAQDGRSARVDLLNFFLEYSGLPLLLGILMSLTVASTTTRLIQTVIDVDWTWLASQWIGFEILLGVAAVVLGDMFYYFFHRIMHSRWLWPIHRFHHAAEEFCAITSLRNHPIETALGMIPYALAFGLLGAPPAYLVFLLTFQRFISAIHHSKFDSSWGWVGRWLLVPPRMHAIHHSRDVRHYDSNFAFYFPVWDRWFGTWVQDEHSVIRMGLDDGGNIAHSWLGGVVRCYWAFIKGLIGLIRRPLSPA